MSRHEHEAWDRYVVIQRFKSSVQMALPGINYARVVATHLYDTSIAGLVKKLAFSLFYSPSITFDGPSRDTMVCYSMRHKQREDYDFIVDEISAICGDRGQTAEITEHRSIKQFVPTLVHLRRAWKVSVHLEASLLQRVAASLLVAKYTAVYENILSSTLAGRKRLITFSDSFGYENLITQAARLNGIRTYTAQHGQYRLLEQNNMSSDAEAYANFESDVIFAWGRATQREFERFGIDPQRVQVTGWIRPALEPPKQRLRSGIFGVILNGGNSATHNRFLIESANTLAEKLDLDYVARAHPTFGSRNYSTIVSPRCKAVRTFSTQEYIDLVDFSIGHSSSAIIENLLFQSRTYVLDNGHIPQVFRTDGLAFAGTDDVLEELARPEESFIKTQDAVVSWFVDDIGYKQAIEQLVFGEE